MVVSGKGRWMATPAAGLTHVEVNVTGLAGVTPGVLSHDHPVAHLAVHLHSSLGSQTPEEFAALWNAA
jgi:hypothetical protein